MPVPISRLFQPGVTRSESDESRILKTLSYFGFRLAVWYGFNQQQRAPSFISFRHCEFAGVIP
jgi:hypothetical protein